MEREPYAAIEARLEAGGIVVLDGGTGSELERRGVPMDPGAWCGVAGLEHGQVLEQIHLDYIQAGARVITANTYASQRILLAPAGFGERVGEITRGAVGSALRARERSGREDVLVAGSLSHRWPADKATSRLDFARTPSAAAFARSMTEHARILEAEGCDLILLEMMYYPEAVPYAFEAALATGLPVWAGFSARRGADGRVLGYSVDRELAFEDLIAVLAEFEVPVAGVMHTQAQVLGEALSILRRVFPGPLMAYPDSGFFKSPSWHFEQVMTPDELHGFAAGWIAAGAQIVGGCCGLSPEHIEALGPLAARD